MISLGRAASTDFPDPLLPFFSVVHRSQQVLQATSCISTELLKILSRWLSNLCLSMWRGPPEFIAFEFVLTSPAVSCMSGLSNFDSFVMGGRWPYSCCCGVLSPGLVQYGLQHSCAIAVKLLFHTFSLRPYSASI